MRLFLTLCCTLVTIAHGKPQGYNYGTGISGGSAQGGSYQSGSNFGGGLSGLGGLGAPHGGSVGGFGSFGSASSNGPSFSGFQSVGGGSLGKGSSYGHSSSGGNVGFGSGIGGGNFGAGFGGFGNGGYNAGGFGGQQQSAGFEPTLVHKQFITVSAPEDHESLEKTKHFVIGRPQKNYRVVFIKAPSSSSANVKLSAEYAPQEEKTVIYVLSKKDSSLEVNDIATPAPTVPAKPEVFFIKYKTEDEAQHAQQQIQAEYDKIEGTSEHTDGGIGQQQSVIGIFDGGAGGAGGAGGQGASSHGTGIGSGSSYASASGSGIGGGFVGASSSNFGVVNHGASNGAKSSTYLPPSKTV
ncbi:keratin, type I cytoskeletal 9 [Ceratitis capitata]|uniref:keratin, type I cytoskeletal 9 n=1 Tax=Ceratitis capitata TaxID=7213 RepID=UPI0006188047|nr:keratin, type I cytoskeletal 9 [Ceratitis capitata]